MNEIIRKRKSVRKYDPTPLDAATLEAVRAEIGKLKPLYPDIKFTIEFTTKTKGFLGVKAPHFLIFGSEDKPGSHENIGFIGQQLDLYFSANGLGACWLGASKPGEAMESKLPYVIALAFGKPTEPLHRELSAFKRKHLSAICEFFADERLKAARLAPSGMNMQNWFFIVSGELPDTHYWDWDSDVPRNKIIHCYRKKLNPLLEIIFGKMNRIDLGIAICHIWVESEKFSFVEMDVPTRKDLIYLGTVV